MSGPGRRAAMPPTGYARPSTLAADGLVVQAVGPSGQDNGTFDFRGCAGPEVLKREVAAAFARLTSGSGGWTTRATCTSYAKTVREFLRCAAEADPPVASGARVTPAFWKSWMLRSPASARLRRLVLLIESVPAGTREVVQTRHRARRSSAQQSYSLEEFHTIRARAARTVRQMHARIEHSTTVVTRWRTGESAGYGRELGALLDQIVRTGEVPYRPDATTGRRRLLTGVRSLTGGHASGLAQVFPSPLEMAASAVLLICQEGWNVSVLEDMEVPDFWPNADGGGDVPAIHRVEIDKPRRGTRLRHSTNNLIDVGPGSAGGVLRQVVASTRWARETLAHLGTPSRRLLLARRSKTAQDSAEWFSTGRNVQHLIELWAARQGLDGSAPDRPPVRCRTLRRTVLALSGGPRQNTPAVHEGVYLMEDEQVRAASTGVVAQGLEAAVKDAERRTRMRKATGTDPGVWRSELGLSAPDAAHLAAGRLDTATAACADFEHSPFSASGPCAVSFLMCFACPNAVATDRHLPRIAYLHQALESLRSAVSGAVWTTDWAVHHARVEDFVRMHTTAASLRRLHTEITAADRAAVDRMLDRRLDS
ncbi:MULTISPECIES: hypothetical protein [unclassified Streptomyces]|uniref:hypothetical protein n=1 Tax=unclassified Streptomyces TaxID=2593676 RepID=UPI00382F46D1